MAKLKIGDIVEIKSEKGLVYAIYTHQHKMYGALLRVFNNPYLSRPDEFLPVVGQTVDFSCFFPLKAAVEQGLVSVVANVDVPNALLAFPIFRTGVADPKTQTVANWWLWDGAKEWPVGGLTQEQRKLPIRGVWNLAFLVERVNSRWTPETDPVK